MKWSDDCWRHPLSFGCWKYLDHHKTCTKTLEPFQSSLLRNVGRLQWRGQIRQMLHQLSVQHVDAEFKDLQDCHMISSPRTPMVAKIMLPRHFGPRCYDAVMTILRWCAIFRHPQERHWYKSYACQEHDTTHCNHIRKAKPQSENQPIVQ